MAWRRARRRHGWLDHLARAAMRYDEADGGRLAAAVTYYAFFATFALALLGFAIFGFLLDDPAVLHSVQRYLVAFVTTALAGRLVHAAGTGAAPARWLLAIVGLVLGVGVNTLLSIAVLTGLPRLRMPLRRVLGPALLVAAGLEVLKTLGRLYVQRTEANPTYQVVAGAVGLLVFLNVVNQLLLFAATLTATSTAGNVTDLAVRSPSQARPR